MNSKKHIWHSLAILLMGVMSFGAQCQQKNSSNATRFSGEWKAKESISTGGNIVCTYLPGDRMLTTTMKIAASTGSLTIEVPGSTDNNSQGTSPEKLHFDGKEQHISYSKERWKKYSAKLSPDGKTVTVNSVVHLMVVTPYNVKVLKPLVVNVTEVWKLSDDGRNLIVRSKAYSNSFNEARSWQTVFRKVS